MISSRGAGECVTLYRHQLQLANTLDFLQPWLQTSNGLKDPFLFSFTQSIQGKKKTDKLALQIKQSPSFSVVSLMARSRWLKGFAFFLNIPRGYFDFRPVFGDNFMHDELTMNYPKRSHPPPLEFHQSEMLKQVWLLCFVYSERIVENMHSSAHAYRELMQRLHKGWQWLMVRKRPAKPTFLKLLR